MALIKAVVHETTTYQKLIEVTNTLNIEEEINEDFNDDPDSYRIVDTTFEIEYYKGE